MRGVGVLVFLFFTILVGWLAKGLIGRSVIHKGERIVGCRSSARFTARSEQVAETFFSKKDGESFDKVVLVEFPRPGTWALGFVSTPPEGRGVGGASGRN